MDFAKQDMYQEDYEAVVAGDVEGGEEPLQSLPEEDGAEDGLDAKTYSNKFFHIIYKYFL